MPPSPPPAPTAENAPGPPLVEVRDVTQQYGTDGKLFTALKDIGLTIREGELVALVGPSGCGKSTLLRIITGLQKATSGGVLYRGVEMRGVNPHATIVFQTFALFPWLTVQANVEVALKVRGVGPGERTARAEKLLTQVGLAGFESAYPRELSGGMRQKTGFARALAVEPELLCLDEPFSALDVLSAEALRGELMELWTAKSIPTRAILMVTHNIEEAVFMADRIVVMGKGPGRVVTEIPVRLPHPRARKSDEFLRVSDTVYAAIAGQTPAAAPDSAHPAPAVLQPLPDIALGSLNGLIERLFADEADRVDIHILGAELGLDLAALMPLLEAGQILGFLTLAKGDAALTPLGETLAEATIATRQELYSKRLRRLPLIRWMLDLLYLSDEEALPHGAVLEALAEQFPPEEAERQLRRLIAFGRYAGLLDSDDTAQTVRLTEPAAAVPGDPGLASGGGP
ncbi:MAG: ATP-binding cassette domain-containing protein [Phycisphaerales bacterium]|nr:ATP-binding cassette domain-containing protein [Phycisphaerales bacterium]